MKVELDSGKYELINFAINTLIADEKNYTDFIKNAFNEKTKKFDFDIELKINGKEFDFMKLLQRIVDSEDEIIEKQVKKVLIEKFENIQNVTNNIIENLEILDIDIEKKL